MRIAVIIRNTTFHEGFGGFETQNKVLCEGLVKRGHKVVVFSPQKELGFTQKRENGVDYHFVQCIFKRFSTLYSTSSDSWLNKSFEAVNDEHEKDKFDLVISQSSSGLGVIKKKNILNVPVVSISHGSKIGEVQTILKSARSLKDILRFVVNIPHILRAFFITQRQFIHGSDKVVAVSSAVKQKVLDETYVDSNNIVVINNGIDGAMFEGLKKKERNGEVVLIYAGRVLKEKGLFMLVRVFSYLKKDNLDVVLNIYGDGEDLESLKNEVSKSGLDDSVNFNGKVQHDVVISKLSEADIFVLPTMRIEGFPMVVVEALFAGLPIVATDIGGISDAVIDGFNGFLVKVGDENQLFQQLKELIQNEDLRNITAENSKKSAYDNFTLGAMLDSYEQVFKEVLKK